MSLKKTTASDLDKFIEESEKARKMSLSQEDIEEINKIAREAELEEDRSVQLEK